MEYKVLQASPKRPTHLLRRCANASRSRCHSVGISRAGRDVLRCARVLLLAGFGFPRSLHLFAHGVIQKHGSLSNEDPLRR